MKLAEWRKQWKLILGIVTASVLIVGLIGFSLINKSISDGGNKTSYALNIALVNEDQGGTLNNVNYNFGNNFTKFVNGDSKNTWNVTSRGIADSGLKDNTYDMEIIIPANFTKQSIQLGSANPKSALISYRVNQNRNQRMRFAAEQAANNVLSTFNKKIVNVYFSSIVNNLHQAQVNVGNMVKQETTLNQGLTQNVNNPFSKLTDQFKNLSAQSDSVQSQYSSWKDSANSYNTQVNSDLQTMIQNNQAAVQSMSDYSDKENQLMTDNQAGVQKNYDELVQQESDLGASWFTKLITNDQVGQNQFSSLIEYIKGQFGLDSTSDSDSQTPTLASQIETVNNQNAQLQADLSSTDTMLNPIASMTKSLASQRTQMLQYFFGDAADTEETQQVMTDHLATTIKTGLDAISADDPTKSATLNKTYLQYLNQIIHQIPGNAADKGTTVLATIGNTSASSRKIANQLALIDQYKNESSSKISYATDADFTQSASSMMDQVVSLNGKTVTATLPTNAGDKTTISFKGDDNGYVSWNLTSAKTSLASQLSDYSVERSGNAITITKSATTAKSSTTSTDGSTSSENSSDTTTSKTEPVTVSFTPSFDVQGAIISSDELDDGSVSAEIDVDKTTSAQTTLSRSAITAKLSGSTSKKTDYLKIENNINLAYNLIALFYGGDTSRTNAGFDATKKLSDQAGNSSVEQSTSNAAIAQQVAQAVSKQQYTYVQSSLKAIDDEVTQLTSEQAQWQAMIKDQSDNISTLKKLMQTAQDKLPTWQDLNETQIKVTPVSQFEYKVDLESGPKMVAQFSSLSDSANQSMQTTQQAAAQVPDMTSVFTDLKQSTDDLESQSQQMIKESNSLTTSWTSTVSNNGKYNNGFQQVLANTKNGGADNQKVYQYLTNPVTTKNAGTVKTKVSFVPYYLVLISVFSALFTAYLLSVLERRRQVTDRDKFKNINGLFWQNMPWTGITAGVGIGEGLLITVYAWQALKQANVNLLIWLVIIVAVQSIFVSGFTYLLRQLRSGGMLIAVALIALYLFLTPSIGVKINTSSWTELISAMSPLQAIENVYTTLLNSSTVSVVAIVFLAVGVLGVWLLNLVVDRDMFKRSPRTVKTGGIDDEA